MIIKRIRKSDLNALAQEAKNLKTYSLLDSTGYYSILKVTSADGTTVDVSIEIFKMRADYHSYFGIYISPNDDTPIFELNHKTLEDIQPSDITDYTESLDTHELKFVIRKIINSYIDAIKKEVLVIK